MYTCYLITNNLNSRKYVGITDDTIESRWSDHIYNANYLKDHDRNLPGYNEMYQDMIDQNFESFEISIIEGDIPAELAESREQYYINLYGSIDIGGYNIRYGGSKGNHHETTKEKMRNAQLGKKHSQDTINKMRAIKSGDNNPNYGTKWTKDREAKFVATVAERGHWTTRQDVLAESNIKRSETLKKRYETEDHKNRKSVNQVDIGTLEVIHKFKSAQEAAEYIRTIKPGGVGSAYNSIRDCCTGRRKSAYGYMWVDAS